MPCLGIVLALLTPRLVIVVLALFTDYIGRAFDTLLWPLLGFFLMPTTTLAYAWSQNTYGAIEELGLVAVIIGVVLDLGLHGGGGRGIGRRRR